MTNRLTEQQLQEELLDEIGDFTKAPQPKAPQPKAQAQAQPQAQPQGQTKTKPTGVLKNLAKNLGDVAVNTAAGSGYDYRQGVNPNPTTQVPVDQTQDKTQATTKTTTQPVTKRGKTGGRVAGQVSGTDSAKYQRQRRADIKSKNAVKTGIDNAQTQSSTKKTTVSKTDVPGQKGSKTAQDISKKRDVTTAKLGKDTLDLNDPKMANIAALINKQLGAGTTDTIGKLPPADKSKLKKAIS
jgi:hypothetical protein